MGWCGERRCSGSKWDALLFPVFAATRRQAAAVQCFTCCHVCVPSPLVASDCSHTRAHARACTRAHVRTCSRRWTRSHNCTCSRRSTRAHTHASCTQNKVLVPPCIRYHKATGGTEVRLEIEDRVHRPALVKITADHVRIHITSNIAADTTQPVSAGATAVAAAAGGDDGGGGGMIADEGAHESTDSHADADADDADDNHLNADVGAACVFVHEPTVCCSSAFFLCELRRQAAPLSSGGFLEPPGPVWNALPQPKCMMRLSHSAHSQYNTCLTMLHRRFFR